MDKSAFHVIAKPIGPVCNLACKYCFYLEKELLYPHTNRWSMTDDVLEIYIRQYIAAQSVDTVHFAWQGGEPTLLGVDFFRKAVLLQKKYANGKHIENSLQTNGICLNDEWGRFLAEADFLVGLSIDGPKELHDCYRKDSGGHPTFDRVLRGLEILKQFKVPFNTLTCVHRKNSVAPLSVYNFLKAHGSGHIQFIPIVECASPVSSGNQSYLVPPSRDIQAAVTDWSVEPEAYGQFLCAIFDEWVRKDVGKQFIQLFDVALEIWLGMEASLCVFRSACGRAIAMEHSGDVYSCDHFVYPENRLGNLMQKPLAEMAFCSQQVRFGQEKKEKLPQICRKCDVEFACHGECPKHRFVTTPEGEYGLNYLCPAYQMFFRHVGPYMRFMADELRQQRAPANIMSHVQIQDAWTQSQGSRKKAPGRNAPCPCGSGKKYKHCCGKSSSA
ncbi:MAG: anaerobic sulfatase maturase [Candidatus Korobacteraceae bacterium]|jgi:uncharacterized protein